MPATMLGWNNYVTTAALSAGSAIAALPVTNLADPSGSPSVAWQTASGVVTSAAGAVLTITPAASSIFRVLGLFRTNLTASAAVVVRLYSGASLVYTSGSLAPVAGYGQVVLVLPSDTSATSATVSIDDPTNPDGFINVPLAYAGRVWVPSTASGWETSHGRDDSSDVVTTRGGQEFVTLRWQRRRWELALNGIRAAEVWVDVDQLSMTARTGSNVLFVPDQASTTLTQDVCYGRLTDTADVTYPYQGADRRAWRAKITERL